MIKVSPIQFKEAFLKALYDKEDNLMSCWSGPQRQFTSIMLGIFPEVAQNLNLFPSGNLNYKVLLHKLSFLLAFWQQVFYNISNNLLILFKITCCWG